MKPYLFKLFIILSVLLLVYDTAYSQKYPRRKFELSVGYGWPEMGALKIKYGENFQVGISQGFMLNTSAEVYYHFTGKPRFTDRKVWYGLGGLEYFYWGMEDPSWFPYLRLGRTFNLTQRYGLNLDLGAFYLLHKSDFFSGSRYSPSGSFSFFIRL